MFYRLIRHGALEFLPEATGTEAADIARWFSHSGVFASAGLVLDAATQRDVSRFSKRDRTVILAIRTAGGGTVPHRVQTVADAFQSLQEARESADYDGNYDPVRAVTSNHVQDAKAALEDTRLLWAGQTSRGARRESCDPCYRTFLRLALLKSGGPKGR